MENPFVAGKTSSKAERQAAPEASQLHGAAHEHIGQVLLTAEAAPEKKQDKSSINQTEKHVSTLSRAELLALSEKIMIDGTSLRQIYETHLVGERGLRRLIAEHLHGGDVKKSLRHEILEHEIDFERDPALRDMTDAGVPTELLTRAAGGGKEALDQLVKQAASAFGDDSPQASYYKARAALAAQGSLHHQKSRRLLDISLTAVIAALILAIIIIFLTRR